METEAATAPAAAAAPDVVPARATLVDEATEPVMLAAPAALPVRASEVD